MKNRKRDLSTISKIKIFNKILVPSNFGHNGNAGRHTSATATSPLQKQVPLLLRQQMRLRAFARACLRACALPKPQPNTTAILWTPPQCGKRRARVYSVSVQTSVVSARAPGGTVAQWKQPCHQARPMR